MIFTLEFDMENNVTRRDVFLALNRVAATINRTVGDFEEGDSAPIRGLEGSVIGKWTVTENE